MITRSKLRRRKKQFQKKKAKMWKRKIRVSRKKLFIEFVVMIRLDTLLGYI
jgi:hypothetical protein